MFTNSLQYKNAFQWDAYRPLVARISQHALLPGGVPGPEGGTWSWGGVSGPGGLYLVGGVPGPGGLYLVLGVYPPPGTTPQDQIHPPRTRYPQPPRTRYTWSGGMYLVPGGVPGWMVPVQVLPPVDKILDTHF